MPRKIVWIILWSLQALECFSLESPPNWEISRTHETSSSPVSSTREFSWIDYTTTLTPANLFSLRSFPTGLPRGVLQDLYRKMTATPNPPSQTKSYTVSSTATTTAQDTSTKIRSPFTIEEPTTSTSSSSRTSSSSKSTVRLSSSSFKPSPSPPLFVRAGQPENAAIDEVGATTTTTTPTTSTTTPSTTTTTIPTTTTTTASSTTTAATTTTTTTTITIPTTITTLPTTTSTASTTSTTTVTSTTTTTPPTSTTTVATTTTTTTVPSTTTSKCVDVSEFVASNWTCNQEVRSPTDVSVSCRRQVPQIFHAYNYSVEVITAAASSSSLSSQPRRTEFVSPERVDVAGVSITFSGPPGTTNRIVLTPQLADCPQPQSQTFFIQLRYPKPEVTDPKAADKWLQPSQLCSDFAEVAIVSPFATFIARMTVTFIGPGFGSVPCEFDGTSTDKTWTNVSVAAQRKCRANAALFGASAADPAQSVTAILWASTDPLNDDEFSSNNYTLQVIRSNFLTCQSQPVPVVAETTTTTTPKPQIAATSLGPSAQSGGLSSGAIGGIAAAGAVVGLAIIALIIFFAIRRYRNRPKQTWRATRPTLALDLNGLSNSTTNGGGPSMIALPTYAMEAYHPVPAERFRDYVESQLERDSGLGYAAIWDELRVVGLGEPTTAAELPDNRLRNRFTNVLPLDTSRVILKPWPASAIAAQAKMLHRSGSNSNSLDPNERAIDVDGITPEMNGNGRHGPSEPDYINASYIPGMRYDHEYIATQGPLPGTVIDFWKMVWQQHAGVIVMLTRLRESGMRKCEWYWPSPDRHIADSPPLGVTPPSSCSEGDGGGSNSGDGSVTHLGPLKVQFLHQSDEFLSPGEDVEIANGRPVVWTTRDFKLTLAGSEEFLIVRQFCFNVWPDQGIPSAHHRVILLRFVQLVRGYIEERQQIEGSSLPRPSVVHCSAGVGRSGAFIAIDILLQQLCAGRHLDVAGVVRKLREHRQLVQTEQQFRFIHETLIDAIDALNSGGSGGGDEDSQPNSPPISPPMTTFRPPAPSNSQARPSNGSGGGSLNSAFENDTPRRPPAQMRKVKMADDAV